MTADPARDEDGLAEAIVASYRRAIDAVALALPAVNRAACLLAEIFEGGGRLIYVGAGASGLIAAEDASELPGTFGLDARRIVILLAGGLAHPFDLAAAAEDDAETGKREIEALGALDKDAVIAVSASGTTPYTVAAARAARERGAFVVGVACRPESALIGLASAPLLLRSGAEALDGSTRLAAGAAQKCALGLLSTRLGQELGHVYRGRMVNLRADNEKLRARALHIVADVAGAGLEQARAALRDSGGDVKSAILIAAGSKDLAEARRLLNAARGRIPAALAHLGV